eukprot:4389399-Pleurochrysis_carterae.AAC.1
MAKALSRTNKSNNLAAGTPMQPVGVGPPQGAMSYAYGPFSMPAPMGYPNGAPPMMAAQGMEAVVKMRGLPYKCVSRRGTPKRPCAASNWRAAWKSPQGCMHRHAWRAVSSHACSHACSR